VLEEGPCVPFPLSVSFVNPDLKGPKSTAHYMFHDVPGHGGCTVVHLKLTPSGLGKDVSLEDKVVFDDAVEERRQEADKEQINVIDNISVVGIDEDELRRLMMEREQKSSEEIQ